MPKYWLAETPIEVRSNKVWLSYFVSAGRLQVARVWFDDSGSPQRGKTVTLSRDDLAAHPEVIQLLEAFLAALKHTEAPLASRRL